MLFPHPDSPTRPSVRPRASVKDTPSTARMCSGTRRSATSSERVGQREVLDQVADLQQRGVGAALGHPGPSTRVSWASGSMRRHRLQWSAPTATSGTSPARHSGGGQRAARREGAPLAERGQVRRRARDRNEPAPPFDARDRLDQADRVRVARPGEELGGRRQLHDLARVHHRDPVHRLVDDAQIVGDQDQGHAELPLERHEQPEDLGLDRHVEGRGGLVGQEEPRLPGERDREHHPLPLPAGELVRVGAEPALRIRDPDVAEELEPRGPGAIRRACPAGPRRSAARRSAPGSGRSSGPGRP